MSLRESVQDLVGMMRAENTPVTDRYAALFDLVLKASEGAEAARPAARPEYLKALDECVRGVRRSAEREEASGERMAMTVGGTYADNAVPVKASMRVGECVAVGDEAYQLGADGQLHFSARETVRLHEARKAT